MIWDLSPMVKSTDPVTIKGELDSRVAEAGELREKYRGKVGTLDAQGLLKFLELKDDFFLKCEGEVKYCFLLYSADSTVDVSKELLEAGRKTQMKLEQALAFADVELGKHR